MEEETEIERSVSRNAKSEEWRGNYRRAVPRRCALEGRRERGGQARNQDFKRLTWSERWRFRKGSRGRNGRNSGDEKAVNANLIVRERDRNGMIRQILILNKRKKEGEKDRDHASKTYIPSNLACPKKGKADRIRTSLCGGPGFRFNRRKPKKQTRGR